MGFNVNQLDQMLNNLGQDATWELAEVCPCKSTRTGGANVTCQVCNGNGLVWNVAIQCRVALEAMSSQREFAMLGMWEKGDIMISLPTDSAAYGAGEWDRFTLLNSTLRIDQVLMKGTNDTLKYSAIVSIESLWAIVAGMRTDFTQGIHFTLNGNVITWLGTPIPIGTQYSVLYVTHPQYFCYRDLVMDRQHGSQNLPRKVHARLMELFRKTLAGIT